MYARLNPLITQLPQSGQLKDGRWVSNYHLLPDAVLKAEGWLTAEEVKPVITEKQMLVFDTAVQMKDRIVLTYKVVDNPPDPILAELEDTKTALTKLGLTKVTTWTAAAETKLIKG